MTPILLFVFVWKIVGWLLLVIGLVWWALAGPRRGARAQRSNLESE